MILEMTRPVQGGLRQERKLEVTSNHLANADTAGFKKDVVSFDKLFKAKLNTDLTQAGVKHTGNPLDIALTDEGFFKVDTAAGVRYTRNGAFSLNSQGVLVDQNGDAVLGQGGPITIDAAVVDINAAGEIRGDGAIIDQLDIVTFGDLEKLQKEGVNNFVYTGNGEDEVAPVNVAVAQGSIELSGVKPVEEMVNMIDHHRMYETFQKMMMTFDEVDGKAINSLGKLQ
ncbi:MAG: flagellar hook-basal body protein [Desulfobacteraceae bacterium]|nr:flagellar hook-basal body protein [Desulfobacteraceae bacterium]